MQINRHCLDHLQFIWERVYNIFDLWYRHSAWSDGQRLQYISKQAGRSGSAGTSTLHWRHNDHGNVSNHQPHHCLLNRLFRRRSKKTSKLRVTGLCVGNSPGPVNSPHKGPVTRKMVPFDDVIMNAYTNRRVGRIVTSVHIPTGRMVGRIVLGNPNCLESHSFFQNIASSSLWYKVIWYELNRHWISIGI